MLVFFSILFHLFGNVQKASSRVLRLECQSSRALFRTVGDFLDDFFIIASRASLLEGDGGLERYPIEFAVMAVIHVREICIALCDVLTF